MHSHSESVPALGNMSLANVENFTLALPRVLCLLLGELGASVKKFNMDESSVGALLTISFHGSQQRPSRRQRRRAASSGKRTSSSATSARPNTDSVERLPASSVIEAPGTVVCPTSDTVDDISDPPASAAAMVETQQTHPPATKPSSPTEMVVGVDPVSPPQPWDVVRSPTVQRHTQTTQSFRELPHHDRDFWPTDKITTGTSSTRFSFRSEDYSDRA